MKAVVVVLAWLTLIVGGDGFLVRREMRELRAPRMKRTMQDFVAAPPAPVDAPPPVVYPVASFP